MEKKDVKKVLETLMAMPSMQESIKVDLKLSRQSALLLHSVIERGLKAGPVEGIPDMLELTSKEQIDGLSLISDTLLEKAGLKEAYTRLRAL